MKLTQTKIAGVFVIDLEPHSDNRGFFARIFSPGDFALFGLETHLDQISLSHNTAKATLRGLHYQAPPHGETKLVRCIKGEIFDVAVDLRPDSKTYLDHVAVHLKSPVQALYIPKGCAHGFQTLQDNTLVLYQIGGAFVPKASRGLMYNDPHLKISWPLEPGEISEKDRSYARIDPESALL